MPSGSEQNKHDFQEMSADCERSSLGAPGRLEAGTQPRRREEGLSGGGGTEKSLGASQSV